MRSRRLTFSHFWLIVILLGELFLPISAKPTDDPQPLKATIQVISQKYCREDLGYTVVQKLRVHLVNQTSERLIVEKTGVYDFYVARDPESLSKGVYEYRANFDWTVENSREPQDMSPSSDFAILAPGDSFERVVEFGASIRRPGLPPEVGALQPGNHVLQFTLATWDHTSSPEEVRMRWKPFGRLVSSQVKTEPFALYLPPDPKIGKCK